MKKNTPLYILLVVLLLANGFFLFKHFGDKQDYRGKDYKRQKNFIARQLNFNDSQLQQYQVLKSSHREIMKGYDDEIRVLKDEFYGHISMDSLKVSKVDSIATLISYKEKQKDLAIFDYFRDVRLICNEDQKEQFGTIIKDALHRNNRKGRDGPRKREGSPRQ